MKQIKIMLFLLLISMCAIGQDNNRFGLIDLSKKPIEAKKLYDSIEDFHISNKIISQNRRRAKADGRSSYTNSTKKFMPQPIDQMGSSCAFASCIGYIYSYELNSLYNREASNDNKLSYFYSWNYWNEGSPKKGGFPWWAWTTIEDNGWMFQKDFNHSSGIHWADGYANYSKGFIDGAKEYKIAFEPQATFISRMKSYLVDKAETNSNGGLVQFSAFAHPLNPNIFNEDTKFKQKGQVNCNAIIPKFGYDGMHSMTIVGYDDDVWYDYNEDNIKDSDEMGAFHCINTWGNDWGDNGYFYAPYKTFIDFKQGSGGTGNGEKDCCIVTAYHRKVSFALKIKMIHPVRNQLYIEYSQGEKFYKKKIMNKQGGRRSLQGEYSMMDKPLTVGLNLVKLPENTIPSDIKIKISNNGMNRGYILGAQLIQYTDNGIISYDINFDDKQLSPYGKQIGKIEDPFPSPEEKMNLIYDRNNKSITLFFNNARPSFYQIDVLSTDGKLIYEGLMKNLKEGRTYDRISLKTLTSGDRLLRILTGCKIIYKHINIK